MEATSPGATQENVLSGLSLWKICAKTMELAEKVKFLLVGGCRPVPAVTATVF
jgi:hypothetical protein